jgi:membrane associated rhomboid family serine protease
MGWLGYLLGRAYFSRRIVWIITAVLVVFFFGTLLGGLFPSVGADVSWQAHVAGFAAGVLAAWLMHPRGDQGSRFRRRGNGPAPGTPARPQPLS